MKSSVTGAIVAAAVMTATALAGGQPRTLPRPDDRPGAPGKPIKVFILMGQSNMVGMGDIGPATTKGTLAYLTRTEKRYPFLVDGDRWTERKDVYYYDARLKKGAALSPIASNGKSFGPEVGFGYVMGHVLNEPVLVLKSCIGNRALGWDLLPPGSRQYTFEGRTYAGYKDTPEWWVEGQPKKVVNWYAGKQYDLDMANAKAALKNIASWYPGYKDQGYEIAGFVWWQGHRDTGSAAYASKYEENLARLIESLRKDYNAPKAKFVLATGCGNPGTEGLGKKVAEAQLAIGDVKKHPTFQGNVKVVDSRDLWRGADVSPRNQGYHYNRNAETFLEVGLRLGWAMADLLAAEPEFRPDQSKLPVPPPRGATVLLGDNGKHLFLSMAGKASDWPIKDGVLVSTSNKKNQNHIVSKLHFKDADIHVEFLLPEKGSANSGVYIHGHYEIQILNSFGKQKVTQEDAGALYGFAAPLENACRKPGEWQVFDIRYRAPRRDDTGTIVERGTVTVWFNGKKVQDGTQFGEPRSAFHPFRYGTTPYLKRIREQQKKTMVGPVFLQDHGNPVQFRNVWVLPADEHARLYEPRDANP